MSFCTLPVFLNLSKRRKCGWSVSAWKVPPKLSLKLQKLILSRNKIQQSWSSPTWSILLLDQLKLMNKTVELGVIYIGYIGLSLGTQDPRGPPANCGTSRVDCGYMISSVNIRQNFILFMFPSTNQILCWWRQGLPTSFHKSQYDPWSSRMPTIVSTYSKHIGCVLCLLNRTDCYVWIRQKNMWLFDIRVWNALDQS